MATPRLPRLRVGAGVRVPVAGGGERPYISLDNAASTPPLTSVLREVNRFCRWYGNVHRGTGFKSQLSSWAYEDARDTVRRFVAAPPTDAVLFCRSTTQGINHVASRLPLGERRVILVSSMEHHSNDLPWRRVGEVKHIRLDGHRIDEEHLRSLLRQHGRRVALVAVAGASNVTGAINPVHRYARWAHEAGALILVDAAQLAPHRPIDMRPGDDPEHLDFLAFSAHKMYAPFGGGALVGPRSVFADGDPYEVGGGTVDSVSVDAVAWTALPEREEAGTPCVIGAVALGAAIRALEATGWAAIQRHEADLTARALRRLGRVPGLRLYGDADPDAAATRVGCIAFNLADLPHALTAAALSAEWGIGTRNGCFCAHIYLKHLLGLGDAEARQMERRLAAGDRRELPGAVRISIGAYNTARDIDTLGNALDALAAGNLREGYALNERTGEYHPSGMSHDFSQYLAS